MMALKVMMMMMMMIIIIIIIPVKIIYTTLFQVISSSQIFPLKLHMNFLPLHCYMSSPSSPSFGYLNNIYKIEVNDKGDNQEMYDGNAIPVQAYYRLRRFQEFEVPKFRGNRLMNVVR
jgi:hypothetical protein